LLKPTDVLAHGDGRNAQLARSGGKAAKLGGAGEIQYAAQRLHGAMLAANRSITKFLCGIN
jgi:hypothetical protein